MDENEMLYCLIAFILGYLVSKHIGNGFNVGGVGKECSTARGDDWYEGKTCDNNEYCDNRGKQRYGFCVPCKNYKQNRIYDNPCVCDRWKQGNIHVCDRWKRGNIPT